MSGQYGTIVADPPWPFEWNGGRAYRRIGRGERHLNHKFKKGLPYSCMSIEDIAALPVAAMAADDSALFLWIPDCHLIAGHGETVARAWGFEPLRLLIWRKSGYGLGRFPRPQHEALIVCKRGHVRFQVADTGSVVDWKTPYENGARAHSRKPDGALDLIERASPGPYLEMFARRARFGWDYWGDESLGTAEMPAASTEGGEG